MTYTQCKILNHTVEFKLLSSGYISVGVDGWLVGNYESDSAAIVAALEHVRLADGMTKRPLLPGRVRAAMREMATVDAG